MTIVSPASRLPDNLPATPGPPPLPRPAARPPAADTVPAPTASGVIPPAPPGAPAREHPALAHYRAVQRLPVDGTETWIGRIDMRV